VAPPKGSVLELVGWVALDNQSGKTFRGAGIKLMAGDVNKVPPGQFVKGRVRFYRRDDDGQLEFTGENDIEHTPKDETLRLYTGSAFDLTSERSRTEFRADYNRRWIDESFQMKVRNHKTMPVEVRTVEHLYRWTSWDIVKNCDPFKKINSQTVEFVVQIPPDGEKTANYKVRYSW
jgi:hypothetical protein